MTLKMLPGLKKKSAAWQTNQSARVRLRPGSNLSECLKDINFAALYSTDLILTGLIDKNLLKRYTKNQEAGNILRVIFALSK